MSIGSSEGFARLSIHPLDGLPLGARSYRLDCVHGMTRATFFMAQAGSLSDADVVQALIARHQAEVSCTCARRLAEEWVPA